MIVWLQILGSYGILYANFTLKRIILKHKRKGICFKSVFAKKKDIEVKNLGPKCCLLS
jgi:hypothetical protein